MHETAVGAEADLNSRELKRQQSPLAPRLQFTRVVVSRLDAIAALVLIAVAAFARLLGSDPVLIRQLNLLDDSWVIDIAYRCGRGNWLGKDVVFTYGPLYEFMVGLPARLLHQTDVGFIYRTWPTIPIALSILLVYGIGRLLLGFVPAWKRLLFLLGVSYFWCPFDIRPILIVFVFAVLARGLAALTSRAALFLACVASLLVIGAFLVSADTGIYSAATLFIVLFWTLCFKRQRTRETLRFGLIATALIGIGMFVVNAICASLFDFRIWRSTVAQVSNYRWGQPSGLLPDMSFAVKIIACASVLALGSAWMFRRTDLKTVTRHPLFLVSGFCVATLCLQSGLVRSDWAHLAPALFPAICIMALLLLGTGPVGTRPTLLWTGLALVATTWVAFVPAERPWESRLLSRNWKVERVSGDCPSGTQYFQQACLSTPQFQALSNAAAFLKNSSGSEVLVFPYENVLAVAGGKVAAGGVLQTYAANGDFLMAEQLKSLGHDRPELAIYGLDDIASWRIDDVSNFSRSPKVWYLLQQNYRFDSSLGGGFLGLRKDEARSSHWKESCENVVGFGPKLLRLSGPGIYDLGDVAFSEPYDFIRLQVRLTYPIWWKLSKPSAVALLLQFSDGSMKVVRGIFPPNQDTEFWIYPWAESNLARYFLPDPQQWRLGSYRPAVTHLAIGVAPYDSISVLPSAIEVHKAEAVSITLQ